MARFLSVWKGFSDGMDRACLFLSTFSLILITLAIILVPVLRVMGISFSFLQEMPPEFAAYIAFPVMGVLLKTDRHVGVDILKVFLKGRAHRILMVLIQLGSVIGAYMLMKASLIALDHYLESGQAFETEFPVPTWIIEAGLVIGSVVLLISAIEMAIEAIVSLARFTKEEKEKEGAAIPGGGSC